MDEQQRPTEPTETGEGARRRPSDERTETMCSGSPETAGAGPPPLTADDSAYRLGSVLGEGGMAIVYEAHDAALDRSVAVKVLKPALAADPELKSRFLYEARILGQLDHPGVIPVFTAGALPTRGSFYAMKKVRGRTLRDILKTRHRGAPRDAEQSARLIDIFEKVCQTVAYAHAQGILHRDLKPENIMVDEFGVVLVLDWGLSKKIDESPETQGILATQVGTVKGTPAYMSPEQARGSTEEVDFRTDVFSLGIVLYEMLTGSLPFSGQSRTQVMQEILHSDPTPPREVNRRASRTLSAICMKALSKDPARRYPSAEELADDIQLYRGLLPTSAYRPGPLESLGNWIGRHRSISAAIGTALVLLLAFAGFQWHRREAFRIRRAERESHERLLAQLEDKRQEEALQKSLLAIKTAMGTIRDYDERILALHGQRAKLGPADTIALKKLERDIAELNTARDMVTNGLRSTTVRLFTELRAKTGGDMTQVDPEVLKFFRSTAIESVASYLRRGDYYTAHYYTWYFLRNLKDSRIQWSDAQVRELEDLREQAEAKLREQLGPDIALPDWEKYADKVPRRKRD